MTQNIIFRFTLGKTHEDGKNMLLLSIRRLKRLYPEAKIVVCYNNVDDLNNIEKLNIILHHVQNDCGMEYLPINEMWKMYPPRYDINSHEIVMDNDFIIFDKCQVLEDFFKTKVNNYKTLAAVYKLFEFTIADNPVDAVNNRYTLIEHITRKEVKKQAELNEMSAFVKQDKEVRLLSYKILVDKFNEKYSGLNEGQKSILRNYINSISEGTELKTFVTEEVNTLQKSLKSLTAKVDDKIVKIKLSEVSNLLKEIASAKTIKDNHILSLLRYHELVKELKKV